VEKVSHLVPGGLSEEQLLKWKADFSDNIQSLAMQLAGTTFSIASSTVSTFVALAVAAGMFLTALYYFLADGPAILAATEELIPLPVDHQRKLCDRFARVVRAVVTATFVAAFAQGLATAAALQMCGIGHFVIFLVIGSIASLIPLAGAWMVWGPCAVWLALQGHWLAAVLLTVWGLAIVGMLDNLVKMYVLQSEADLHPLIAFISVIGALQVMGLWGIFIGPIVASCLFALIQIFNAELKDMAKEREAAGPPERSAPPVAATVMVVPSAGATAIASENPQRSVVRPKSARKRRR
jgi:predicted PurR-regulated permease PerM